MSDSIEPQIFNLVDTNIAHADSYNETLEKGRIPQFIKYVKNQANFEGVSIFTDQMLQHVSQVSSPIKVAWLMEPRAYDPSAYELIEKLENKFNFILTHDPALLKRDSGTYIFFPADGIFIDTPSIKIHEKSKLCSIIYSDKKILEGHRLRHEAAKAIKDSNIDMEYFGSGCNPIEKKSSGLNDFMFSVAIENNMCDFYFTEKILDCFASGTIPVYWGAPNVLEFFNPKGIITFKTIEELIDILKDLTPAEYESRKKAVEENFHHVQKYYSVDDILLTVIHKYLP